MPVLECLLALNNCCISVVRVGCSRAQSLDPFSIYAHSSVSLICSCGFSLFADYSKIYITSPYISSEFQTYIQLPNLTSPLRCLTHSDSLNMSKTEHLIDLGKTLPLPLQAPRFQIFSLIASVFPSYSKTAATV